MWSSRRTRTGLGLAAVVLSLAACQVRPLYATLDGSSLSVAISEPDSRVEQLVRNELVFGFSGGKGEPADPEYRLVLDVVSQTEGVLPSGLQNDAQAGRVIMTARYGLAADATGKTVAEGERKAIALFDFPGQGYGNLRAVRDAENRAARELAALVQADIAARLATSGR